MLMRENPTASHQPLDGQANQPTAGPWASPLKFADPSLETRKGRLYLLVTQGTDDAVPAEVHRRYYSDISFDVLPSLQAALSAVYLESPEAQKALPAAVVIQGLDMYAVGTAEGAVWLVRSNEVKELLGNRSEAWVSEQQEDNTLAEASGLVLYNARRRLNVGDNLVITTREVAKKLSPSTIRQTILSGGSPAALARAMARLATRGMKSSPVPVTVICVPGFTPTPELGLTKGRISSSEGPAKVQAARQASPIWPALVLALLVISVSLWIKRSSLSRENLSALLGWLLTPVPTITTGAASASSLGRTASLAAQSTSHPGQTATRETPTRTPKPRRTPAPSLTPSPTMAQEYAMPELKYPLEGGEIRDFALTLKWVWAGSLTEDEYFDVRLWQVGTPKRGIAWTKDREYTQRYQGAGGYYWTVVVIRGKDGSVQSELSQEPKPIGFEWQIGDSGPTATYTPAPTTAPTRSTPVGQPTRITATPETAETPPPTLTPQT